MRKSALNRTKILARLRQFEQDAAQATLLHSAHNARQAEQNREQLCLEAETIGAWKVPTAIGGTVDLEVYAQAVQAEFQAMKHLAESERQVVHFSRNEDLAREAYGRSMLASDVVNRRERRLETSLAIAAEHHDADAVADMWLGGVKHECD